MSKRGRPASLNKKVGGSKRGVEAVDYSKWEEIGNQLRVDAAKAVHVTKSGHPTSSASIADILAVLFFHQQGLKVHPKDPAHFLNDRLVLSKGHAAPVLYAAFYRAGIITLADLMSLRLKDSLIQGHPVPSIPFVDVATGSLGQGLSVAAGMAYSSKYYDKIGNRFYCIVGDGETAEGSIWEAVAFASHYELNNLVIIVDVNSLGQSQHTMLKHDVKSYAARFQSFGCKVLTIDGHSIADLVSALAAFKNELNKPCVMVCKTEKGKGYTQAIEGKLDWHGKDLGAEFDLSIAALEAKITNKDIQYTTFAPEGDYIQPEPKKVSVTPKYELNAKISTRKAYGNGLLKARESCVDVVGLDGDTKNSTFAITLFEKHPDSFIECYIAEQNMIGVATGLACRQKIPFCSTFACFLIRGADQIRIAGISGSRLKMVGSHSGCSIGEDGPSQMALEDLGFFRAVPKCLILIPSDGVAAEKAVELAANYNEGPAYIRTARPDVAILYPNDESFQVGKFKTVKSTAHDQAVIIAAGVLVHQSLKAYNVLLTNGIHVRIIDIFSLKPLDQAGLKATIAEVGGKVVVAEEHYAEGGLYDVVCAAAFTQIKKTKHLCVRNIPGSATPVQQLQIHGLCSKSIEEAVRALL